MTCILNNQLLGRLTRSEIEVLRLVFSGLTSKKIAQQLSLSSRTVEIHRTNIMRKLNLTSVAQLANVVLRLMHRNIDGFVAGGLFVLPSLLILIGLSWLYIAYL